MRDHIPIPKPEPKAKSPRKRIAFRSKSMISKMSKYAKLREKFLKEHPYCQWTLLENKIDEKYISKCGWVRNSSNMLVTVPLSVDIHHKKGRGKYLLDTKTWMAVSRKAHDYIHSNPKEAYEKGYLINRSEPDADVPLQSGPGIAGVSAE